MTEISSGRGKCSALRKYKNRSTRNRPIGVTEERIIVIPMSTRKEISEIYHDNALADHVGRDRTWEKMRGIVWWPKMKEDMLNYIAGCDKCQLHKRSRFGNKAELQETDVPDGVFEKIQIDFIGPY